MSCSGCAERGALLGKAASGASRGAWQEAASAARAAAVTVPRDLRAASAAVARATAAALSLRR